MKRVCYHTQNQSKTIDILIRNGISEEPLKDLSQLANRFAIITDSTVGALHGENLLKLCHSAGLKTTLLTFPAGELNKIPLSKEKLENALFEQGFGRDSCIIGFGGGVTTDLAGFIAATFCRGIPLTLIPTSLMGMVDAAIGGKVGVNTPYGKNLIGAIHQPEKILIYTDYLKTLPFSELKNGFAETIKHALIQDAAYFTFLEEKAALLFDKHPESIETLILRSCEIKAAFIEADERENNQRRLLNFGHTLGHALEKMSDYSISHGEAVAIGILGESYLSKESGLLSEEDFERIWNLLKTYQFSLKLPAAYSFQEWQKALSTDKKSESGKCRFVLLDKVGRAATFEKSYCKAVEPVLLKHLIEWITSACYSS